MTRDPLLLTTAIEAVVRAGEIQLSRLGSDIRVDKKGAIDLVTEVDVAIERSFRDLVAERFPDHQVLGEEMGGSAVPPKGACWVFDPPPRSAVKSSRRVGSYTAPSSAVPSISSASDAQKIGTPCA